MKGNKRRRPRSIHKIKKRRVKKANLATWALLLGLFLGTIGFTLGSSKDMQTAIKLAAVGFGMGAVGGAVAALGDRLPKKRNLRVRQRIHQSGWRNYGRPFAQVPYLSDEYYLEHSENNDEEGENEQDAE